MAAIYVFAAALAVLAMQASEVRGQQDQCFPAAQALMKNCAEAASISNANFLWFVSNGTSSNGQAPANPAAFKSQICDVEQQIGGCIFSQLGILANTTCAQSTQVLTAIQNFLLTFDNKCAPACRFTLIDDLRQCYVNNGLSADLFLTNRSAGHVIGANKAEVDLFCSKKDALLGCMKPIHDDCPEALPILSSQDFHLPSYEKGVTILCAHPAVYLKGLECFAEPTSQVESCVQKSQQAFLQATVEAQNKNWTQMQFIKATCMVTINQADCDLTAWSKKNHEACNNAVIGLRREMECSLLPPNCTTLQKSLFDRACHVDKFHKNARNAFSKGGTNAGGTASRLLSLPGSLLLVLAFLYPVVRIVSV